MFSTLCLPHSYSLDAMQLTSFFSLSSFDLSDIAPFLTEGIEVLVEVYVIPTLVENLRVYHAMFKAKVLL